MQYQYKFTEITEVDINGRIQRFPKGSVIYGEEDNLTIATLLIEKKIERVGPTTMQKEIKP